MVKQPVILELCQETRRKVQDVDPGDVGIEPNQSKGFRVSDKATIQEKTLVCLFCMSYTGSEYSTNINKRWIFPTQDLACDGMFYILNIEPLQHGCTTYLHGTSRPQVYYVQTEI